MNNSYVYPNYQGNNMRVTPNGITNIQTNNNFMNNHGRIASFYLSFPHSEEWRDTIFKGYIQEEGNDYTIIRDATTGKNIWFWNKYIDYVIFEDGTNN